MYVHDTLYEAGASQLLAVDGDELRTLQFVLTVVMKYIGTSICLQGDIMLQLWMLLM